MRSVKRVRDRDRYAGLVTTADTIYPDVGHAFEATDATKGSNVSAIGTMLERRTERRGRAMTEGTISNRSKQYVWVRVPYGPGAHRILPASPGLPSLPTAKGAADE